MRWTDLFDDLEAQLTAQEVAERQGEVVEHTRAGRGRVFLSDRYLADVGRDLRLTLRGGLILEGGLTQVGQEWLLLSHQDSARGRESLVLTGQLVAVQGLSGRSDPGRIESVQRALGIRQALRALSRDRAVVRMHLVEGATLTGTIDRVGADHLDLSAHPADLPRRSRAVHSLVTVPYAALTSVVHRGD
ncbi:hypothetical protein [Ornithinimicrobium murale]|uniref:hypothetical protein n=1 Tax=Ornithinimicrobium murale TaxID=1050153 RepID=UPI000E0CEBD6|nr:hypothetical protein [Ornithinimicrobium murale]